MPTRANFMFCMAVVLAQLLLRAPDFFFKFGVYRILLYYGFSLDSFAVDDH